MGMRYGLRFEAYKNIEIVAKLLSIVRAQKNLVIVLVSSRASLDKSGLVMSDEMENKIGNLSRVL
jgi:hypothetical protein